MQFADVTLGREQEPAHELNAVCALKWHHAGRAPRCFCAALPTLYGHDVGALGVSCGSAHEVSGLQDSAALMAAGLCVLSVGEALG